MQYGIIGNCKSAALVSKNGSIDWCCLPKFDSPSVFAKLLDPKGGNFQIQAAQKTTIRQFYIPKTNILQTEFDDGKNAFALIDYMPRYLEGGKYSKPIEIHRIVKRLRGRPTLKVTFAPRLNYAWGKTRTTPREGLITASHELETLFLYSNLSLEKIISGEEILLKKDLYFLLTYHEKIEPPTFEHVADSFLKTQTYWEKWSNNCRLPKLAKDHVLRSALTLKLMTYEDSGAIIAAPTTSLPEIVGDVRNWDYRFCWLRDASLMLEALKSIGHFDEARAFIHFLLHLFESKKSKVRIVYGIGGRGHYEERVLEHLKGYKNSKPVRVGNQAFGMRQNDIFGEILNTIYLYYFHYNIERMPDESWELVKFLVNTIAQDWQTPDAGIWEFRHSGAHFTFSKILSWVALDRGIKIAQKLGKKYAVFNWNPVREKIRKDVEKKGWNNKLKSFVQIYGSPHLDASLLLMQRYGFMKVDDPRWVSTVYQCEKTLMRHGFGFRYISGDDFGKPKSSFILATLWIAQALHSIGEKDKALKIFENVSIHSNHLGLLSEDINPHTGELLGNFPQAYSHMAFINTANLISKGKL